MKYSIPVTMLMTDNGDGGFSIRGYNNEEEMLSNYYGPISEAKKQEILNGYDEYENGYIDETSIEIEIIDGVARLTKPLRFHAGQ